uniref:Protein kinase domain-containing protein n=1 Tax=Fagus sylvatica TaxID=28930 RepID=A0A2N9I903_FAGSY
MAINSLYVALGYPPLIGWLLVGGDPCGDKWQGVECVFSNITELRLSGQKMGGVLGGNLGDFGAILTIDLSNNNIGGTIPSNFPSTIRNLSLSANKLIGSIPDALSSSSQLMNLDLSGNNLSGQLPPSLGNLPSLTTLHLQNNKLTGTLDVLQDLPLQDLNIQNNLFSGPIPTKLLSIPNFRKDGNPFNTTVLPSPPTAAPPPLAAAPYSEGAPWKPAIGPFVPEVSKSTGSEKFFTTKRITWQQKKNARRHDIGTLNGSREKPKYNESLPQQNAPIENARRHDIGTLNGSREKPKYNESLPQQNAPIEKVPRKRVEKPLDSHVKDNGRRSVFPKLQNAQGVDVNSSSAVSMPKNHETDTSGMSSMDMEFLPPPPPPFFPIEKVSVEPMVPFKVTASRHPSKSPNGSSVKVFTVAMLQHYTSSFSQENLIGDGMLGSVYRGELPDGKLLAIKKLDSKVSRQQSDDEFFELVSSISKLRHANIVELVGYCAEHGQRLLVYEYCRNGTLHDALHDDEIHKRLSWKTRIQVALGAARALEYLHETCQPPIVHRNFKSANLLLDDNLELRVSDCGMAPLLSSGSASQLSGRLLTAYGYGAPEFDLGIYTYQSDVFSFGVVMLELLTGRKSYDRSRPRAEQFLVRWAVTQLHDIDALARMVDPSLKGAYPIKSLSRFADIISSCVQVGLFLSLFNDSRGLVKNQQLMTNLSYLVCLPEIDRHVP